MPAVFRHFGGQDLGDICYSDITFLAR